MNEVVTGEFIVNYLLISPQLRIYFTILMVERGEAQWNVGVTYYQPIHLKIDEGELS